MDGDGNWRYKYTHLFYTLFFTCDKDGIDFFLVSNSKSTMAARLILQILAKYYKETGWNKQQPLRPSTRELIGSCLTAGIIETITECYRLPCIDCNLEIVLSYTSVIKDGTEFKSDLYVKAVLQFANVKKIQSIFVLNIKVWHRAECVWLS